jgi:hypothetical protein
MFDPTKPVQPKTTFEAMVGMKLWLLEAVVERAEDGITY